MISVIVTSYNQRPTLELLLESLARQTTLGTEVIVADDGSKDGSETLCSVPRNFPIRFITQEDLGYRKSKILNQAIRASRGEYLVFLDADVLLERHFIEDHLKLRYPGSFVCGRRVDLGPQFTQTVTTEAVRRGDFDKIGVSLIMSALRKDTHNLKRGIRITYPKIRKLFGYDQPIDILGSNFSAWKKDLEEVNGFNEAMESYWGEDGDLFVRLRNSGKKAIGAKSLCIQYHLFHPRRTPTPENQDLVREMLLNHDYTWAKKGVSETITTRVEFPDGDVRIVGKREHETWYETLPVIH